MSDLQFNKLFEPGRIGQITVKNRIAMAPMGTNLCDEKGRVNERIIDYYAERARGGVGLLIIENAAVDLRGRRRFTELIIADDSYIPGFQALTDAVHKYDAKVALQLCHRGRDARSAVTGQQPVAPSPIPAPGGEVPHELTTREIREIVEEFALAAVRAKRAGFDSVEIHACHQYLLSSFLSSATNQRVDEYGGSLQNRARFFIETIVAVREAVGKDYPVWCRLTAQEIGIENGITTDETRQVARMAVKAGSDAIHLSTFGYGANSGAIWPETPGQFLSLHAEIKNAVNVPVITAGWFDPQSAEQAIQEGKADFIAMGRRVLADPAIANKAGTGKADHINPCIGCLECANKVSLNFLPIRCSVNPALGRENEYRIEPARTTKKVLVIGAGPAGMEAARVATLRGHKVVLIDKKQSLGGKLNLAKLPPKKEAIGDLIEYFARELTSLSVEVKLGTEATGETIVRSGPDAVVIATGSIPMIPNIRGVGRPNVLTAEEALVSNSNLGPDIAIIGGGCIGCEVADLLSSQGKIVAILEATENMAADMVPFIRRGVLERLTEKKVTMLTKAQCDEILEDSLIVIAEKRKKTISAETVIIATGFKPDLGLYESLQGKVPEIYSIGDCSQPARIMEAIDSGARIGCII